MTINVIFKGLCPNCSRDVSSNRLEKALPCTKCLPSPMNRAFKINGYLRKVKNIELKVEEVDELFKKAIGSRMWGLQRLWARRFFNNESFAMIAPTGSGKTTMQVVLAIYAALNGRRSLILVPTSLLASHVHQKTIDLGNKLGLNDIKVVAYHSLLSEREKSNAIEKAANASIIITTPVSLMKRPELQQSIDIAFIDDVDSFLRRSKSIDIVLKMLGITEEEWRTAEEIHKLEGEARKVAAENPSEARRLIKDAQRLRDDLKRRVRGMIIVSGATQTAKRTKRVQLLNTLYGFSVGGKVEVGRNIVDMYIKPSPQRFEEALEAVVRRLGTGGLIYVPMDKGVEYVEKIAEFLKSRGLKVEAYLGARKRVFEKFVSSEIDALIGIASYRSPLTRGIDLPERVRYAVFAGVPKFMLRISVDEFHPGRWLILLNEVRDVIYNKYPSEFNKVLGGLIKIRLASRDVLEAVRSALKTGEELTGYRELVRRIACESLEFINKVLKDPEVVDKLTKSKTITFGGKEGEYYFIIPDATAYIQASGRTSRLYVGGLTKGLSILIIDDEKAFNALLKDLKLLLETIDFREYDENMLSKVIKEVDMDRRRVKLALEGKLRIKRRELMKTALFIVESPNKARTIARFFGRPTRRIVNGLQSYEVLTEDRLMIVTATGGHILDLVTNEGFFGVIVGKSSFKPIYKPIRKCIRCGRDTPEDESSCPFCGSKVFVEAKPIIEALRHLASQVDEILIGTDPDSEGEKIAWDVMLLLKPLNSRIYRVRFHEVTRRGLTLALKSLTNVDRNMVEAQIVRRIEDRWIGFSLSPILWRKFGLNYLSAGRVQTPVLGWIVERTDRHKERADLITLKLKGVNVTLFFKAPRHTAKEIKSVGRVNLRNVRREVVVVHPPPPYTTDSMLSDASRILKLPAMKIMDSAQRLFEAGLITYHRTDSTTVSAMGISIAKDYISRVYGENYFHARKWEKPGAHECIRPTKPLDSKQVMALRAAGLLSLAVPLRPEDYRLYDLVFKRFVSSQMKPCIVEKTTFTLDFKGFTKEFSFITKVIDDGFNKLNKALNPVDLGGVSDGEYEVESVKSRSVPEHPLYTYSDLVELMRDKGIGRPSTYAKILDILKRRGYVVEVGKNKLIATLRGKSVFKYLNEKFHSLVNEERTRILQEKIDLVEAGKEKAEEVLKAFYQEVKPLTVVKTI